MPARRRRKNNGRRRSKPMFRVTPALESYMIANVATQNLMGGNPLQVLLGDLNAQAGTGTLGQLMGPQPGVISIKELLSGSMNAYQIGSGSTPIATTGYSTPGTMLPGASVTGITTAGMAPLDAVAQNFKNNIGNIIIGTTLTTAGFRIANRVLRKPKSKFNKLIRDVGLGSTVQL